MGNPAINGGRRELGVGSDLQNDNEDKKQSKRQREKVQLFEASDRRESDVP